MDINVSLLANHGTNARMHSRVADISKVDVLHWKVCSKRYKKKNSSNQITVFLGKCLVRCLPFSAQILYINIGSVASKCDCRFQYDSSIRDDDAVFVCAANTKHLVGHLGSSNLNPLHKSKLRWVESGSFKCRWLIVLDLLQEFQLFRSHLFDQRFYKRNWQCHKYRPP